MAQTLAGVLMLRLNEHHLQFYVLLFQQGAVFFLFFLSQRFPLLPDIFPLRLPNITEQLCGTGGKLQSSTGGRSHGQNKQAVRLHVLLFPPSSPPHCFSSPLLCDFLAALIRGWSALRMRAPPTAAFLNP